MHGTMGKEKIIKTKQSATLKETLNTSHSVKGTSFKKTKHTWQRADNKRNYSEN